MTLNGRKLSQKQILDIALKQAKPIGKVTGDGRGIIRHDTVLMVMDNHKFVSATTCATPTEARRMVAQFR